MIKVLSCFCLALLGWTLAGQNSLIVWPAKTDQKTNWKLPPGAKWEKDDAGDTVLRIANTDPNGGAFATYPLDLPKLAGKTIRLTTESKAVNVSKPSHPIFGIKLMLPYSDNGEMRHPAAMDGAYGNFAYTEYTLTVPIPQKTKPTELILGLQNATGEVFFRNLSLVVLDSESFLWPQSAADLKKWSIPGQFDWQNDNGRYILHVSNREQGKGGLAAFPLDLKQYAGKLVEISADIKAVDVSQPKVDYLGVKLMLPYKVGGSTNWPSATDGLYGSFDFKRFQITVALPPDTETAVVNFGLQDSTGDVYFRDFKIRVVSPEEFRPLPFVLPKDFRCQYSKAVQNAPMARGVMTPDPRFITREDIADLGKWGATLVRWQFISGREGYPEEYRKTLDDSIAKLLELAPDFRAANIKVVFDMHSPPGGRYKQPAILGTAGALAELDGSACLRLFMEEYYYESFISTWRYIAERLKGVDIIWGYDLLNEPSTGGQNVKYNYLQSQYEAAKAIREVDPETPIIIECDEWADPNTFLYLKPLPLLNIFYQFHFYLPGIYTHQGVGEASKAKFKEGHVLTYPSAMEGSAMIDRTALSRMLQPVRDFQKQYGAKLFCGELSAIRWAPGAEQYIDDVISLLEELQCSWTYHAYREWQGWSVEHDENIDNENRVNYDTGRKKVLLKYFKKNQK